MPSVPPGGVHTATSRAPRPCFALPSASTSFRAGTRRACTTPLTSSPQRRAPQCWVQPSALPGTSMHGSGSQCEPVTRCALRLAALTTPPRRWSRVESLRHLAAQLSSLATLEVAVAHDVQALLEAPPEPVVPIPATGPAPRLAHLRPRSRSRSPLPKAAPSRPRGSILLNQRGPTGLSVKTSPVTPPDRSSASAAGLVESRCAAGAARSSAPSEPCAAASDPTASAARKASQRRRASGAAGARQRRRDKHRRPVRRATKRSM